MYRLTIEYLDGRTKVYERSTREEIEQLVNLLMKKKSMIRAGTKLHLEKI